MGGLGVAGVRVRVVCVCVWWQCKARRTAWRRRPGTQIGVLRCESYDNHNDMIRRAPVPDEEDVDKVVLTVAAAVEEGRADSGCFLSGPRLRGRNTWRSDTNLWINEAALIDCGPGHFSRHAVL